MKLIFPVLLLVILLFSGLFFFTYSQIRSMLSRADKGELPKNMEFPAEDKKGLHLASEQGRDYLGTLPCEDLYIQSCDHLELHGYYYPAGESSRKYVICIHGFKSEPLKAFGPFAEFYHEKGYNLLLADNRGHGKSQGQYMGSGVTDRFDCVSWAEYFTALCDSPCEILLHGVSMGGAAVLSASGEKNLPRSVKGIISDCGFTSMYEQVKRHIRKNLHLPAFPALQLSELCCRMISGYSFKKVTPLKQVEKAAVPLLFVHGEKDHLVPVEMARTLYHHCSSEKKKLLLVPGAGHSESVVMEKEKYFKTIEDFFM